MELGPPGGQAPVSPSLLTGIGGTRGTAVRCPEQHMADP